MFDRAFDWFKDLPLGRKQLLAIVACELVPLLGLGVGTLWITTTSLRAQLTNQAKSELAVTETNYNIKINQMGFGSRGQSDNVAVIEAVKTGGTVNSTQIQQILRNEVQARQMEYATLVDADKKIIANANTNRKGELFDPNELVTTVLQDGQQIKASVVVPRPEVLKESPTLSQDFREQTGDALVRFVVTPIREPGSRKIIGALIFGDVVNGKLPIVQNTRNAFDGGYSAVYQRSIDGKTFTLSTAIDNLQTNVPIPADRLNLLTTAAQSGNGKPVTDRMDIGGRTYTVAVQQLPDRIVDTPSGNPKSTFSPQAPAFLVRGTSEDAMNALLMTSLFQKAVVLLLSLGAIGMWSWLFRKTILSAIHGLSDTTLAFTQGDRSARAPVMSKDEIGQLAQQFNQMADSLAVSEQTLSAEVSRQEQQTRDAQTLNAVVEKMRGTLNFDSVVQTAVKEIRSMMNADRVLIYQFSDRSLNGIAIAESVISPYTEALGAKIENLLQISENPDAETQTFWCVNDVEEDVKSDRHREHLAHYQVKANLVAPIRRDKQLIGLLAVHQCRAPRNWQIHEMNTIVQLANQIGYALDQAQILQRQQQLSQGSESLKNDLQQQIQQLLQQVQASANGDLTVRASATGDLGTIATAFNAIIENLQKLVVKVQDSTRQVNTLLKTDEGAVRSLSLDTHQQSIAVADFKTRLVDMTASIDQVAASAQQASTATQQSNETFQANEGSMDLAVQKISLLRSTIEDTALKVRQLGQSSAQISRIVSLINEFAVQTDVLAVNAGLEANRAGEQGRGFSIIATEIGGLAARSSQASRDIAQIVESIQLEINGLIEAMTEGTSQAADSSHQIRNTKQTLAQLSLTAQKVTTLVESISHATVHQAATAQSIQTLMATVESHTHTTTDTTQQVSQSLAQTIETAQALQTSIELFKV
jgi:twitching motility protein PilJ